MTYPDANHAAMMGRPAYMTGAAAPAPKPKKVVIRGHQPSSLTANNYNMYTPQMAYQKQEAPYVAPTPIVGALRDASLNPNGIRRNSNTFKGTRTAAPAPTGKVNPNGVDRSARVSATTNE